MLRQRKEGKERLRKGRREKGREGGRKEGRKSEGYNQGSKHQAHVCWWMTEKNQSSVLSCVPGVMTALLDQ